MKWSVVLLDHVESWFRQLLDDDNETAQLVAAAVNLLEIYGPNLGRPLVDRIEGSKLHNLKELRPGSSGQVRFGSSSSSIQNDKLSSSSLEIKVDIGANGTWRTFRSLKRDMKDG
jgi:transcriptional regulator with XRE-family HTH domain